MQPAPVIIPSDFHSDFADRIVERGDNYVYSDQGYRDYARRPVRESHAKHISEILFISLICLSPCHMTMIKHALEIVFFRDLLAIAPTFALSNATKLCSDFLSVYYTFITRQITNIFRCLGKYRFYPVERSISRLSSIRDRIKIPETAIKTLRRLPEITDSRRIE